MGPARCTLGFSTKTSTGLEVQLEGHSAAMDAAFRRSQNELLLGFATLHDAVDAALAGDPAAASRLAVGLQHLHAANDQLSGLGESLVRVRTDLFASREVNACEPLLARESHFATLDYDALYRELVAQGAALPLRNLWDEVASRLRDGGARAGLRLLERYVRELQSDLRTFIAHVESIGRQAGRALGESLHDTAVPTARLITGYTRLLTTFGYVSHLCGQAMTAFESAIPQAAAASALAIG
jgi:hypothetical protein